MKQRVASLAGALLLAMTGGCATVAVYAPTDAAEISLESPGAELRRTSRRFCETARNRGLAAGEASLQELAGSIFGTQAGALPYWRRIGADSAPPSVVVKRIRTDIAELTSGLALLNGQAGALMSGGRPTREDVNAFELVLIHGNQARDSLAEALNMAHARDAAAPAAQEDIAELERALDASRTLADDLAAAQAASDELAPTAGRAFSPA